MLRHKKIRKNRYKRRTRRRSVRWPSHGWTGIRIIFAIGALAIISWTFIYLYSAVMQSAMFQATSFKVTGNRRLTTQQVLTQARFKPSANIFAANLKVIRNRLLAHPWIAGASVRRIIPDTILLHVTEHRPLAVIEIGRKYLLNTQGVIFKEKKFREADHLPIVRGLSYADLHLLGDKPSQPPLAGTALAANGLSVAVDRNDPYRAMLEVLRLGGSSDAIIPNGDIKVIEIDRQMGLTLHAFDNVTEIRLGYNDYQKKYDALKKVKRWIKPTANQNWNGIRSIDLKNPDRIVLNPIRQPHAAGNQKEV